MPRPSLAVSLIAALAGVPAAWGGDGEWSEGEVLFAVEVAPVFAQKCGACHGDDPAELGGDFDLRTRDSLLAGGESGDPGVVPGAHSEGYLYELLKWEGGYGMPPKEADKLTEEQRWAVRDWIDAGAPWPDAATVGAIRDAHATGVRVRTSGGLADDWTNRTYAPEDVWAYRPRTDPPVPANPAGFAAPADPVDAFLNSKLAAAGLEPAPRADRRTLVRRVTFDLTGLPPAPADVAAFLADPRDDAAAFAAVVDRLLESPHYGEQLATRWLDVARYADSAGLANDFERPNAWRYRDYVVRAFNDDKPFDRFVREQIAGDELVDDGPLAADSPEGIDAMVATGFLRMAPWEHTGMSVHAVTRGQFLDEVTDAVGQAFLAQPLQCAKCHDHKFDPIPTRDYYAIRGAFVTTQFADRAAPFRDDEDPRDFGAKAYLRARVAEAEAIKQTIEDATLAAEKAWYADRGLEWAPRWKKEKAGVPEDEIAPKVVDLTPEQFGLGRVSNKAIQRHEWELDRYEPFAFAVYNGATVERKFHYSAIRLPEDRMSGELQTPAILTGGDVFSRGEAVAPGVLSAALLSVADPDAELRRPRPGPGRTDRRPADRLGEVDHRGVEPADCPRLREPAVAVGLRAGDLRERQQLRRRRGETDAPGTARPPRRPAGSGRLADEAAGAGAGSVRRLRPRLRPPGPGGRGREGPGRRAARRVPPPPAHRGGAAGRDAGGQRRTEPCRRRGARPARDEPRGRAATADGDGYVRPGLAGRAGPPPPAPPQPLHAEAPRPAGPAAGNV